MAPTSFLHLRANYVWVKRRNTSGGHKSWAEWRQDKAWRPDGSEGTTLGSESFSAAASAAAGQGWDGLGSLISERLRGPHGSLLRWPCRGTSGWEVGVGGTDLPLGGGGYHNGCAWFRSSTCQYCGPRVLRPSRESSSHYAEAVHTQLQIQNVSQRYKTFKYNSTTCFTLNYIYQKSPLE